MGLGLSRKDLTSIAHFYLASTGAAIATPCIAIIAREGQDYAVSTNILTCAVGKEIAVVALALMGELVKKEMTHAVAETTSYKTGYQLCSDATWVSRAVFPHQTTLQTNAAPFAVQHQVRLAPDADCLNRSGRRRQLHDLGTGRHSRTASSDWRTHIANSTCAWTTTLPTVLHHIPTFDTFEHIWGQIGILLTASTS